MKPHLKRIQGLWHCGLMRCRVGNVGIGYTPGQAYADWVSR